MTLLRAALRSVTWRQLLVAQLLAAAMLGFRFAAEAYRVYFPSPLVTPPIPPLFLAVEAVIVEAMAVSLLTGLAIAEQAVRRGARARLAFGGALLAATCTAALLQWVVRAGLGLDVTLVLPGRPDDDVADGQHRAFLFWTFFDTLIYGGLVFAIYLSRRRELQCLQQIRAAHLEQASVERDLAESRLAAAQAQIEPQLLFDRLHELKGLYEAGRTDVDAELDALILDLRTRFS